MSYNRWITYSDELYHHGVKGMKWGVRRYQPYADGSYGSHGRKIQRARVIASKGGAKHYQKALNRLDKIAADVDSDRQVTAYSGYRRLTRLSDKGDRVFDSGNMAKYDRVMRKSSKVSAKYTEKTGRQKATYEAAKKLSKELIKEATEKGYTVSSAKTTGLTDRGRSLITSGVITAGIPGGLGAAASGAATVGYRNRKLRNDASWNSDEYFRLSGRTYSEDKAGNYNPYTYEQKRYSVKSNRRR